MSYILAEVWLHAASMLILHGIIIFRYMLYGQQYRLWDVFVYFSLCFAVGNIVIAILFTQDILRQDLAFVSINVSTTYIMVCSSMYIFDSMLIDDLQALICMETTVHFGHVRRLTSKYMPLLGSILFAVLVVLKVAGLALVVRNPDISQGPSRGFIVLASASLLATSWMMALWVFGVRFFQTSSLSRQKLSSKVYRFGLALGICVLFVAYTLSLTCFQRSYWGLLWVASDIWAALLLSFLTIRTVSRNPSERRIIEITESIRLDDHPQGQESG